MTKTPSRKHKKGVPIQREGPIKPHPSSMLNYVCISSAAKKAKLILKAKLLIKTCPFCEKLFNATEEVLSDHDMRVGCFERTGMHMT